MVYLSQCFISVSSLLGINAVELRDALTTNSNVTRGERRGLLESFKPLSVSSWQPIPNLFVTYTCTVNWECVKNGPK